MSPESSDASALAAVQLAGADSALAGLLSALHTHHVQLRHHHGQGASHSDNDNADQGETENESEGEEEEGDVFADISASTLLAMGADELENATHSLTASLDRVRLALRTDLSDADRLALARLVFRPLHTNACEPSTVLSSAARLRLPPRDLCGLLLAWWAHLPVALLLRPALLHSMAAFVVVFHGHVRAEDQLSGVVGADAGADFWHQCLAFCTGSGQILHAALLARMLAAVEVRWRWWMVWVIWVTHGYSKWSYSKSSAIGTDMWVQPREHVTRQH